MIAVGYFKHHRSLQGVSSGSCKTHLDKAESFSNELRRDHRLFGNLRLGRNWDKSTLHFR